MVFTALPTEILSSILNQIVPSDVIRCCRVCRRLRDLVSTDEYLQYVYELGICGYTIPRNWRLDLSYAEKSQVLRERRRAWRKNELIHPTYSEFPPGRLSEFCLVNGTIAWISSNLEASGAIARAINYTQLPSVNMGTVPNSWRHDGLDFPVECLTIQPESDLVVLIEDAMLFMGLGSNDGTVTQEYYEHHRLHVRTMSSNQPHPTSSLVDGLSDLDIGSDGKMYRNRCFQLKTYGHLVAILFRAGIPGPDNYKASAVKIFDWVLGSEITQVEISGTEQEFFFFLGPEYFGVLDPPRPQEFGYDRSDLGGHEVGSLGSLCIYKLPTHGFEMGRQPAMRIATFALPNPHLAGDQVSVQLHSSTPQPLDVSPLDKSLPKIYEPTSESPFLCINISKLVPGEDYNTPSTQITVGALFVSSQHLLDIAHRTSTYDTYTPPILWSAWGHCAHWLAFSGSNDWHWFINGPRAIAFSSTHEPNSSSLLLLDLLRLRTRTEQRGKQKTRMPLGLPIFEATIGGSSDLDLTLAQASDIANVVPEQAAALVPMRGSRKPESVNEVLVDDEHVVILGELVRFRQVESRRFVAYSC